MRCSSEVQPRLENAEEWPEVDELVIATVEDIKKYGVYVRLDEYGKEGFLHISEISSSWVKNIRDFVREGQKVVLRVLRVDPARRQIDLSLRRVTKRERRERILLWKRDRKAEGLLRSAANKMGITFDEIYEKAGVLIEERFGELYEGLERAAREGAEVLTECGVPEDMASVLAEVAKERIGVSMVKVKGTLNLKCLAPNGVLKIKEALLKAKNVSRPRGTEVKIHVKAAPRYSIEVTARDYKIAEDVLRRAVENAIKSITLSGGEGSFKRE
ncbi:MAG: translation initiation factor IF-2 subunit alpha [Candidatus Bathyarchaeota archaeon B26-1]|nr:MAG: translation initiation factor IF-2 subunit alpha [Candidatus Bathyarchaeota archaeon B26-1]